MSVKLGVAPIAWSNDDMPELGGDTTLEQCLDEASQAGYIGVESGGKFPKKSSELIPKLNKYKLHLCSGWYGANLRKHSVKDEIASITSAHGLSAKLRIHWAKSCCNSNWSNCSQSKCQK